MALLINRTDIALFRQISNTVLDNVLNMHITDAQFVDVQKLLGMDFYNDIVRNPATVPNAALLDGGDYTFQSITYTNVGLKAVIVHYAYGRYALEGSETDTPFGFVEKLNPDSQPTSDKSKERKAKSNQQIAFNYWENVVQFLDRNATDYPLWDNGCITQRGNFRISKIDKRHKVRIPIAQRFSRT